MITISGYRKLPVIVREIGKVIDLLRSSGNITGSSEVSGKYTITSSDHGLKDFEVITIDSVDYVVNEVTTDTFVLNADTGIDFTGKTWKAKAPYYLFGHPLDIVNILKKRNDSGTFQYQKYPLICLFQDFEEESTDYGVNARLQMLIVNSTKPEYVADDRYINNFEPILYPILEQFERALKVSKDVEFIDNNYSKTDKLYLGKNGIYGSDGNIFNDFLDAIEINNLNLKFKNNCK